MPVYAKKLMPAVEAASMPYDRRRALRRAAIYDAWVNAGHYHKDIHLTDVALIEIALDAIEHIDAANGPGNRCARHGVVNCKRC